MKDIDKKMIKYHLDQLEKIAVKLAEAEADAENQCNKVKDLDYASAYKYGCMIAITRVNSGLIENHIREITNLINKL